MAETDFTSINRVNTNGSEQDQNSPGTETLFNKLIGRDNETIEKITASAFFYYGDKRDNNTGNAGEVIVSSNTDWDSLITAIGNSSDIIICDTFNLQSGITLTAIQNKPVIIYALTSITINGILDAEGKGALGGIGSAGTGQPGDDGFLGGSGGSGGGSGGAVAGGSGGSGTEITGGIITGPSGGTGAGVNGTSVRNSPLFVKVRAGSFIGIGGAGGGSGGETGGGTSPAGGNGGGVIFLFSPIISIGASGIVKADGADGGSVIGNPSDGGGAGGGGGVVIINARTYLNSGSVTANKGLGGTGDPYAGGNGGDGIVLIDEI